MIETYKRLSRKYDNQQVALKLPLLYLSDYHTRDVNYSGKKMPFWFKKIFFSATALSIYGTVYLIQ